MVPSLTSKMRFFELFIDNKNLIKQGLYMLEICQNAAGSTELVTDCRGHDGLSWTPSSHTCAISSAALLHYPRRQVWRTITGTTVRRGPSFQNTSTLGIWVLDYFSELHDEPAGRTVIDTTDRQKLRNPTLGQTSPSSFSICTMLPPSDCHKLHRWSLLHFFAKKSPHSSLNRFPANKNKLT